MQVLLLALCAATVDRSPLVDIRGVGPVRGKSEWVRGRRVESFLGIKYGDQKRWETSTPAAMWTEERSAKAFGPTCPGSRCGTVAGESEDCLTLNVFRAKGCNRWRLRPVMVYIHGGGYDSLCSDLYDGRPMVARSHGAVLVVTFNYRIGALGFLGSDKLRAPGSGATGNWGFEDQRLALQWVHDHIAEFGGNPNAVTLFGNSAGGASISCHMTSPPSMGKGLFHNVISQSGFFVAFSAHSMQAAEANFARTLASTSCEGAADEVACLKALSKEELYAAVIGFQSLPYTTNWAPAVDGVNLLQMPAKALSSGAYEKGLRVMAGTTRDELAIFLAGDTQFIDQHFMGIVGPYLKSQADLPKAMELYSEENFEYPANRGPFSFWWWATMNALTDAVFTCPVRYAMRHLKEEEVYKYFYTHVPKSVVGTAFAGNGSVVVPHEGELPFALNCALLAQRFGANYPGVDNQCDFSEFSDRWFAHAVSGMWKNFARGHAPSWWWPKYDAATDSHFTLGPWFHSEPSKRSAQCDFWDTMRPSFLDA